MDAQANLAYTLVAAAPSPADTGTTLDVTGGTGTRFPAVPFNATIWPADTMPDPTNAEIVRVTNITTDTLTITRAQESTTARTVIVGDQIAATITKLTFDDVISAIDAVSAVAAAVEIHASAASAAATSADAHAATASAAATSADAHAAAASAAATSVDARVNTVSNLVSALTSALNSLSNVVSDSLSAGTAASNAVSAALVSVDAHAGAASAAATSADAHAAAASAAATSILAGISAVSAKQSGGTSVRGLQSIVNALSDRLSGVVGGTGSVTSTEVSAGDAATSATAAQALSVLSAMTLGTLHVVQDNQTFAANALSDISGMSAVVSAGVTYELDAKLLINKGTLSGTLAGLTFPAMTFIRGGIDMYVSLAAAAGGANKGWVAFDGDSASGSNIVSAASATATSSWALYWAVLKASATGTVQLKLGTGLSLTAATILPGSYLKMLKLQ